MGGVFGACGCAQGAWSCVHSAKPRGSQVSLGPMFRVRPRCRKSSAGFSLTSPGIAAPLAAPLRRRLVRGTAGWEASQLEVAGRAPALVPGCAHGPTPPRRPRAGGLSTCQLGSSPTTGSVPVCLLWVPLSTQNSTTIPTTIPKKRNSN
jgi:hypothetical protein